MVSRQYTWRNRAHMLPFLWPSCYFKTRLPSCALGTSFYTISEGRDLMTYVSDNYTSYSAPSPLNFNFSWLRNSLSNILLHDSRYERYFYWQFFQHYLCTTPNSDITLRAPLHSIVIKNSGYVNSDFLLWFPNLHYLGWCDIQFCSRITYFMDIFQPWDHPCETIFHSITFTTIHSNNSIPSKLLIVQKNDLVPPTLDEKRALIICGIAGENRPTGVKFPMEIVDL